jgi:hypothetical protein
MILLFMLPAIAGMTGVHHHTYPFPLEMGVAQTFFFSFTQGGLDLQST